MEESDAQSVPKFDGVVVQFCDVLNSGDVGGDSGNPKVVGRRGELRGNHTKGGNRCKASCSSL